MKTANITKQKKVDWVSLQAYTSYIFQTFFKRPFGYIISILYIVYLAVILLIVPAAYHVEPLFIWNIGGFNMPIFNLMFIGAASASLAVCVFKTGREDGTDLVFSSKPLTKLSIVLIKTFVYLVIMLALCFLAVIITLLIKPIFGTYNELTNPTGIEMSTYKSLVLSMLFGNLVNFLLFGGLAVFITLFGTQVLTMIITIGVAFLMCLMNFLFPMTVQSATQVLRDKYNSEILSYSLPTLNQYNTDNFEFKNYATIQCYSNDEGKSEPFDTYKYWTDSKKISKTDYINYVDFGKQLSMLFSSFGMQKSNLIEASKLPIGTNKSYRYDIDKNTNVKEMANKPKEISNYGEFPISIYSLTQDRGKTFPKVNVIGGTLNLESSNWYLWTKLLGLNFNSVSFVTKSVDSSYPSYLSSTAVKMYDNKTWMKLDELKTTANQQSYVFNTLYSTILEEYKKSIPEHPDGVNCFPYVCYLTIKSDKSGLFFEPDGFSSKSLYEQYKIINKIQLLLILKSSQEQIMSIENWKALQEDKDIKNDSFPYSSKTINNWYKSEVLTNKSFKYEQLIAEQVLKRGIYLTRISDSTEPYDVYSKVLCSSMNYAETFSNLYQYKISPFYSIWIIFGVWTGISLMLFSSAIIVYKKIDLK